MEKYRKHLKNQNILYGVSVAVLIAVEVLAVAGVLVPPAGGLHWASAWNGFLAGISAAMIALMVLGFVINLRALRSETAQKKLYAKEHDERKIEIARRAQSSAISISLFALIVAVVVSGYFNVTVSLTLLCCVFVESLIGVAGKIYWSRKL